MTQGTTNRRIFAVIYCIVLIVVFFAATEIIARQRYKGDPSAGFMTRDPVLHHRPPAYYHGMMTSPNEYAVPFTTNALGVRGPKDLILAKEPGIFRIAVLGDSFTFGMGVGDDEVFTRILEDGLNRPARRYEVYNFGVNSSSTILAYLTLREEVLAYAPDFVILMFDESDVHDDYLYEPHLTHGPDGRITGCDPLRLRDGPDIWALCMKYSRLCSIIDQKIVQSFPKMKILGFSGYLTNKRSGKRNKTAILTAGDLDTIAFDRFIAFRDGKNPKIVERHWQRSARYLELIRECLNERGIQFIMTVYPYGHQVGADQWSRGRAYWGFEPGRVYGSGAGFDRIARFAREKSIDLIDLGAAMAANKDTRLYFENDGHWTPAGHRVVGRAIAAGIQERRGQ